MQYFKIGYYNNKLKYVVIVQSTKNKAKETQNSVFWDDDFISTPIKEITKKQLSTIKQMQLWKK